MARLTLPNSDRFYNKIAVTSSPTNKRKYNFLRHCGFLKGLYSRVESDWKHSLSNNQREEWVQVGSWVTTRFWTNGTGDCSSPWDSQDRKRHEKCALNCSWWEWSFLEILKKVPRLTRRQLLGFWDKGYKRFETCYILMILLYPEILAAYEGVQAASEVIGTKCPPGTLTASAGLDVQRESPCNTSCQLMPHGLSGSHRSHNELKPKTPVA